MECCFFSLFRLYLYLYKIEMGGAMEEANNTFDVIVIGAGNGGLVAALTLQKKGKKVLLLEKGRVPGGFASSFKRGRFEFDASLHELCEYGTPVNKGEVYYLFESLGLTDKITMIPIQETFSIYTLDTHEQYTMPVGKEAFLGQMEKYVPNSTASMLHFFDLCEEVKQALAYLNETKGHPDTNVLMEKFPNFMVVAPYSVQKVLEKIRMPIKAQEILTTYWSYLGSPAESLSFVHYASMIYSYITNAPVIPKNTSHEISLTLSEEFTNLGGKLEYLSPVKEILIENGSVHGVITEDNRRFLTKHIIADISPHEVYTKLIDQEKVPDKAKKFVSSRVLGARGLCVYLGLNKSMEELGLDRYSYFIYHTLNSNVEYKRMHNLYNGNLVATLQNNHEDTSIMCLTSLLFGDVFDQEVTEENYYEVKEKIAENMVRSFEEATHVNIHEAIEEIEIATPVTFARYTNHPDGVIYGYLAQGYDNLLPRIMNEPNEMYIKNLHFCGGFGSRLSGYSSAYLNGEQEALKTFGEMKNDTI